MLLFNSVEALSAAMSALSKAEKILLDIKIGKVRGYPKNLSEKEIERRRPRARRSGQRSRRPLRRRSD
jgi:hypothetical protein